ncbi:MAG: hypothetical protein JWQ78_1999 [Sediminibacterium sp.]|jgi:hypothetical protein|nr:hypothetical protein [Sediminibacterium sp.]
MYFLETHHLPTTLYIMAKVSLDVPKDKMQSFIQAVISLGIDTGSVLKRRYKKTLQQKRKISNSLKKISSSFILFDWEFFSNELEYE